MVKHESNIAVFIVFFHARLLLIIEQCIEVIISLVANGYWLLAISYWLLAISHWLLAISYWLSATSYWLSAIGYRL